MRTPRTARAMTNTAMRGFRSELRRVTEVSPGAGLYRSATDSKENSMPVMNCARRRVIAVAAGVAVLGIGAAVAVQAQQQPPNRTAQAIHYRQALFTVVGRDFGWLMGMAKDRTPFDAAESLKRARRMEVVAGILPEAFPPDSAGEGSKAQPNIWTEKTDFDSKMQELLTRAGKLTQVAQGGKETEIKAAILSVGEACGQCHDKYKSK